MRGLGWSGWSLLVGLLGASLATAADAPEDNAAAACADVANITVSAVRNVIPIVRTPDGSCQMPGTILPVEIAAQLEDGGGNAVAACPVLFFVDFAFLASCGRVFGEFCDDSVAVTDASGVARVQFTMRQEDVDFCNCLPSGCDPSLCPAPATCAAPCNFTDDLFCQAGIAAAAGTMRSSNVVIIEYGS